MRTHLDAADQPVQSLEYQSKLPRHTIAGSESFMPGRSRMNLTLTSILAAAKTYLRKALAMLSLHSKRNENRRERKTRNELETRDSYKAIDI